jgi:hypothetical protein
MANPMRSIAGGFWKQISCRGGKVLLPVTLMMSGELLNVFGWEAGIRTPIGGFRVRSPTVRRPPSKGISIYVSTLRLSTYPLFSIQLESRTPVLWCPASTPPQGGGLKVPLVELVSRGQNVRAIRRLGKTQSCERFTLPISRHTCAEP